LNLEPDGTAMATGSKPFTSVAKEHKNH